MMETAPQQKARAHTITTMPFATASVHQPVRANQDVSPLDDLVKKGTRIRRRGVEAGTGERQNDCEHEAYTEHILTVFSWNSPFPWPAQFDRRI
jgi:hypothetical protein